MCTLSYYSNDCFSAVLFCSPVASHNLTVQLYSADLRNGSLINYEVYCKG